MGIWEICEKFLYAKYISLRQIYSEKFDKPVNVSIVPLLDESVYFHMNCASDCVTPRNWKFNSEAVLTELTVVTTRHYGSTS